MSDYFREKELLERRGEVITAQESLLQAAATEGRELTAEEQTKFDRLEEDYSRLTNTINATRSVDAKRRETEQVTGLNAEILSFKTGKLVTPDEVVEEEAKKASAFRKFIAFGFDNMSPDEREIVNRMRAAQSTSDSAGGYTIPEGFSNEIESGLKEFGGMFEASRIFPTATGNDLPWPTENNTSQKGEIIAENEEVNEQDLVFASVTLKAHMYSSKEVKISLQLLQDSAFQMESYIGEKLAERIGRITNEHFTTGAGTTQPRGVVTASSAGKVAAATTAFTFAEVLDLKHSVDPAYRRNARFMFSDATLSAIKKLSIGTSDARPLWQPSFVVGEPDRVDGDLYTINQDVADFGTAGNKFMLYGDFSKYIIRQVLGFQISVQRELHIRRHQVGILGFARFDGNLIDAGAGAIKHMAQAAS